MLITWNSDLSVGSVTIDNEHKHWIDLLNNFYLGLKNGEGKDVLNTLVTGMIDYTKFHFVNEEKFMRSIKYPEYESHKEKHDLFVAKLVGYDKKINDGKIVLSLEVTNYLKSWLMNHIKGSDRQYGIFAGTVH